MHTWPRFLALLLVVLPPVAPAQDLVRLKDGRAYQGTVLAQDESEVRIEVRVAGIRSTLTFAASDVESVERGVVDPPAPAPGNLPSTPVGESTPVDEPLTGEGYLRVPLTGTFGEEIQAESFMEILRRATDHQGVRHIVLEIDSPGGKLDTAREMAQAMEDCGDRFRFHAIILRGLSASIWIVFSCDTVHMQPTAVLGAAVPFLISSTGVEAVDQKFVSALAAEVQARAEARGHPGALVAAMLRPEACVVAWRDDRGELQISSAPPAYSAPHGVILEDGPATILTLTAQQAEAIDLARITEEDAAGLGSALGLESWISAGDYGEAIMARGSEAHVARQEDLGRIRARIDELLEEVVERLQRTRDSLCGRLDEKVLIYDGVTDRLDGLSRTRWRSACTGALVQNTYAQKRLRQIRRLQERLQELGARRSLVELRRLERTVEEEGDTLRRMKRLDRLSPILEAVKQFCK